MPVAVYVCDLSGRIQSYNNRAVELWGREPKPGDKAQRYCGSLRLYSPDGKLVPHEESKMAEVLRTGVQARDLEMVIERPDGSRITVLVNIVPLKTGAGEMIGAMNCFQDITDRKHAEEALKNSYDQLRALSARLQSVREEEATRIAREIHDELGQTLTGLKMDLRRAERKIEELESSPAVNALLDTLVSATELADGITASVQEIAANLRPGVLDKLGLGAALHYEGRRFQERTGIRCNVRLPEMEPAFSAELSTALFRIFQECLTNVARHAHASEVEAELKLEAGSVILTVHDNGCGITPMAMAGYGSLGLLGMKERAALLGGEILFEHGPEGGALVTVRIAQTRVISQSYEPV
jgi:signal transduction histidine kinase